jgi:hypothetical protein
MGPRPNLKSLRDRPGGLGGKVGFSIFPEHTHQNQGQTITGSLSSAHAAETATFIGKHIIDTYDNRPPSAIAGPGHSYAR